MSDSARLLEAVREESKPGIWTQGVNLARSGAVTVQSRTADEIVLRVRSPGRTVAPTAMLYPKDEAWECDCPSRVDPCEHVCAAAIALQQEQSQGTTMTSTESQASRVVYRFSRAENGLRLERGTVTPDGIYAPLDKSLAATLANPAEAKRLQVEQYDLQLDRLLEKGTRVALPPERLEAVLKLLAPAKTVLLDGEPVAVSEEPLLPPVTVLDRGGDIEVSVVKDPRIIDVPAAGVALASDTLWRLGEQQVTGAWLQNLPVVRHFTPAQMGELTGTYLPDLARRFPVQMKTRRLPPVDRELKPRVDIELNRIDAGLSVLPTLVYGSPPTVRIDNGRMTYLRGAVPVRDEPAETRLTHMLREELQLSLGKRMTVSGPEMARMADKLRLWRGGLTGDAASIVSPNVTLVPQMNIEGVTGSSGIPAMKFGFQFRVEGEGAKHGGELVDGEAVLRAWREGLGLVPLLSGGWAPLPQAWLEKHGQRVAELLSARSESGTVANHAAPQLGALCDALDQPRPPDLEKLAPLVEGFEKLPEPQLPADLQATLRPYQLIGVRWMRFLQAAGLGGVLADDMGLGKTLQAICVLGEKSLVVCPTSVLANWQAELRRFRPNLKVDVYHGPNRALRDDVDVTLTTYSILRLDAAALTAKSWKTVVLDEAQAIKNPDSQVTRVAFDLQSEVRLALSGTPIENRLDELWSVMHFANRGLLGGRRDFETRWSQPIADGRGEVARALRAKIKPFVLRRLKRDVAPELPPRTDAILPVVLDERERAVYDAVLAATRAEVVTLLQEGGSVLKALEALLRLRQAACHSALVPGQQARTSSKMKALLESLETAAADGHKALVFSQWTGLLDLIEPELKAAEIPFVRLDGSTADRGGVTAKFQADDGPPVMLISLKAGGTGLNLTAADHVFLMDPWWNPAVEAQAADRAHRIGQERPVTVYRLVSQTTVEEKILGLQEKKKELFDAALGEAAAAASITRQDLLDLFAA